AERGGTARRPRRRPAGAPPDSRGPPGPGRSPTCWWPAPAPSGRTRRGLPPGRSGPPRCSRGRRRPCRATGSGSEPRASGLLDPVDLHALLGQPRHGLGDGLLGPLHLQDHPSVTLLDVGPADVGDELEVPAEAVDDRLVDQALGEGQMELPLHGGGSRFLLPERNTSSSRVTYR